ncbi:hypothetical protein HQ939_07730 [Glaesserella parasuis]|uniref:Uncharacterized protein n=1 Tax=Glaesserella parasuis TaxID=738 RepID=A0A6B9LD99_GLAPU|nr:hypothetical protein [Glaesserella parasuis]QKJ70116.1 hypothetical protein HQ939_07730 [Glaesserella parasuis]
MDSLSKKVVYHRVIKTEKDVYYRIAFNSLRMKGYNIQSITCDGTGYIERFIEYTDANVPFSYGSHCDESITKKNINL